MHPYCASCPACSGLCLCARVCSCVRLVRTQVCVRVRKCLCVHALPREHELTFCLRQLRAGQTARPAAYLLMSCATLEGLLMTVVKQSRVSTCTRSS